MTQQELTEDRFLAFQRRYSAAINPIEAWPREFYLSAYSVRRWPRNSIHNCAGPEQMRDVLVTKARDFVKAPLTQSVLCPALGDGMLTAHGQSWIDQRRCLGQAFRPPDINELVPSVMETAEEAACSLSSYEDNGPFDVHAFTTEVSIRVICRSFLGDRNDDLPQLAASAALKQYLEHAGGIEVGPAEEALLKLQEFSRRVADGNEKTSSSFLMLLASAAEKYPERTALYEDNIATLVLAGHDTVALAMAWSLYLLADHPNIQNEVAEEVDAYWLGRDRSDHPEFNSMPLLRGAILEALRLYPPVPNLFRAAIRETTIAGEPVSSGDIANLLFYPMQRSELFWDRPSEFNPRRSEWLAESRRGIAFVPFSAGPRACIGERFAEIEMSAVLAAILRDWRFSTDQCPPPRPCIKVTLRPMDGIQLRISRR